MTSRVIEPLPYKEPVIDLNSKRDTSIKVDQMKDIIKKLVFHLDPELVPKLDDPDQEKKKCDGIVAHTIAAVMGKKHGCEDEPPKQEDPKVPTDGD